MIYFGYVVLNIIFAICLIVFVLRLYRGTPYFYTQLLNFYAFFLIFISLLVLEYGFYITESFNYSYLNGATTLFIFLVFIFFLCLKVFINTLNLMVCSGFKQTSLNEVQKKTLTHLVLFMVQLGVLALSINLFLSPIPFFTDDSVTRINFWEYAFLPEIGLILGETSLPVAIALGVVFNFYRLRNQKKLKNITLFTFFIYVTYLFLLGHKFSAQVLAFFFFWLPFMLSTKVPINRLLKILLIGFFIGIGYVLYVYSKIESGIVSEYGGALGGALYRIFVLQGHVFWNMLNHLNMFDSKSSENMVWLFNNDFYGLELAMHLVSPGFAENYLESGLRFTAGFPAFLFATPFLFAMTFFLFFLFLYAIIVVRLATLASAGSIVRLSIYIFILYFFHFGFTMGDFRFLFSTKFLLFLYLLFLVEVALLGLGGSQFKNPKSSLIVEGAQQHKQVSKKYLEVK